MTHACNPSYLGGYDPKDHSFRPVRAKNPKKSMRLYLNRKKLGWWPALIIPAMAESIK
jgi:hypothetical protein